MHRFFSPSSQPQRASCCSLAYNDMITDGYYECYGDYPEVVDKGEFPSLKALRQVVPLEEDPREVRSCCCSRRAGRQAACKARTSGLRRAACRDIVCLRWRVTSAQGWPACRACLITAASMPSSPETAKRVQDAAAVPALQVVVIDHIRDTTLCALEQAAADLTAKFAGGSDLSKIQVSCAAGQLAAR